MPRPQSRAIKNCGTDNVALRIVDTEDSAASFFARRAFSMDASGPHKVLNAKQRTEIDAEAGPR